MPYENEVRVMGHLGGDAKEFSPGCLELSIATKDGKKQDGSPNTNWHTIKAFGKTVEYAPPLLKGDLVAVRGRIQYREGNGKWYTDIIVFRITNFSRKRDAADGAVSAAQGQAPAQTQNDFKQPEKDDDLPF